MRCTRCQKHVWWWQSYTCMNYGEREHLACSDRRYYEGTREMSRRWWEADFNPNELLPRMSDLWAREWQP